MSSMPDMLDLPSPPSPWRRNGLVMILASLATLAVGCGTLAGARSAGVPGPTATMLTLLVATVWIGLACAPLAAGAQEWFGAMLRGGLMADVSVITLLAVWAWGGGIIGLAEGVKIYLIWAALAVVLSLGPQLGSTTASRGGIAVGLTLINALAMSSLFWSAGLLGALGEAGRQTALKCILWPNPLIGIVSLVGPSTRFVWAERPVMYSITRMGQDFPTPAVNWWLPLLIWSILAAGLTGWLMARRVYRSFVYGE